MKKLTLLSCAAALALAAVPGCKSVTVQTADWSASYFSMFQENDVKGFKATAGDNVSLEIEQTKSQLDPAAQDALRTAASALSAAAKACQVCAGVPVSTQSTSCPSGTCSDSP